MNILEERVNLKQVLRRIDRVATILDYIKQDVLKDLWELKKDPDKNKKDIERMQDWIRGDLPFARLTHCLELPEDRTPYLICKDVRRLPLRCNYADLYFDGSVRLIGRDGNYTCVKDLEEAIGLFYCL